MKTSATSLVTKTAASSVKNIRPGSVVTVVGPQAKDGSYTATSIAVSNGATVARRMRVYVAAVLGAIGIAVVAAGCGGGSSGSAASASTTTGTTTTAPSNGGQNAAAFQAYRACLSAQGVTLPPRPTGGQGGTFPAGGAGLQGRLGQLTATQRQAITACQSKRPAGGFGRGNANGRQGSPALAKYTACLKSHGVTFGSTSASSSAFAKATAACKSLLPTQTGESATGGTTTP